nr:hypothetical protein B0A51_16755 [Rachicladosporium sp. CCFEE 5018]
MFRSLALTAAGLSLLSPALAQITNDFESGWDQTTWATYAPDCNQGGTVALDSTVSHSGKNSIKVTGGSNGYCGHIFFGTTAVPSGDVYVRTWFKADKAFTNDHISFIIMPDAAEATGKHLRFGAMDEILMYNREDNDATLPDLSPQGIASSVGPAAQTWHCLEYHLGTDGSIETWVDSAAVSGLSTGGSSTNTNNQGWSRAAYTPKISAVYFGWEAYAGAVNTLWYDDIAVSGSRIGCGAGGSSSSAAPTTTAKPTTTVAPTTTVKPTTTAAPTTTVKPTTTAAPTTTVKPTTTTTKPASSTTTTAAATSSSCASPKYGQCGGQGWGGCKSCASGSTCKVSNDYYSQCL